MKLSEKDGVWMLHRFSDFFQSKQSVKTAIASARKKNLSIIMCLVFLMLVSTVSFANADSSGYTFVYKWDRWIMGDDQGQIGPSDIVVNNNVVFALGSDSIIRFSKLGNTLSIWGSYGTNPGQFMNPTGIALDNSGNLYVTDGVPRVQKFDSNGNFVFQFGNQGSGPGQLDGVMGVVIDLLDNIYLSTHNNIEKFDSNGNFLSEFGGTGDSDGKFMGLGAIALDALGNIYAVDRGHLRIQKFDSNGNFLTNWGTWGYGDGQFDTINDIAVDNLGNVYVADYYRIQKFDSNGNFLTEWGSYGYGDGQFNTISSVAVDNFGSVFVGDVGNSISPYTGEIQRFALGSQARSFVTTTNSGVELFISSKGTISSLDAIPEVSLPSEDKPADFIFPHGFASFTITELSQGQPITIDMEFPSDIPVGSQYWKYKEGEGWFSIPFSSDDGDNRISITLKDGGIGDSDGLANGIIVDPGGIGVLGTNFVVPESPIGTTITSIIAAFLGFTIIKYINGKNKLK